MENESLPVFDIVERLDDNDEIVSTSVTPTSVYDQKFQEFLESTKEKSKKESEEGWEDVTELAEDKIVEVLPTQVNKAKDVNMSVNVNRIRRTRTRKQKLQEINDKYFDDDDDNYDGSNEPKSKQKAKKFVTFAAEKDNMVTDFSKLEIIDKSIVDKDLSKMSFSEFRKGFCLNTDSSPKQQFVSEVVPMETTASGKGLYDILEERKNVSSKPVVKQPKKTTVIDDQKDEEKLKIFKKNTASLADKPALLSLSKKSKKKKKLKNISKKTNVGITPISIPSSTVSFIDEIEPQVVENSQSLQDIESRNDEIKIDESKIEESKIEVDESKKDEVEEARKVIINSINQEIEDHDNDEEIQPIKETQYPVTKVDYQALNDNLDDMVSAYLIGMYDDDIGIEYDMPNSIIEHTNDIEKYNQQVRIVEAELKKEANETNSDEENTAKAPETEVNDLQPLLSETIVEKNPQEVFEEHLNDYHIVEDDSDDDYTFLPEILNQEIAKNYQTLRQHLINLDSGFAKGKEQEIEPIDENGNPIRLSRFKAAQISTKLNFV